VPTSGPFPFRKYDGEKIPAGLHKLPSKGAVLDGGRGK